MEKEEKQKKQMVRLGIIAGSLVGAGVFVGYRLGKKKAANTFHKKWIELSRRIIDDGETLGLMVPNENGVMAYLDIKPAEADYEGMLRGFLNIYSI